MITLSKYKKGIKAAAIALSICSSGMMVTSCNDFLEMDPHNIITEDMFWNEKADVEQILMGCYSTMTQRAIVSRMMVWGEFRSENVNVGPDCGANDVNLERVLKENITAMNGYTAYGDFYTVINRCNIIIKYAPQVAAKDPSYSQSQLKAHLAEAKAIRSLMYFYLIRTFRDVPYSEEAYEEDTQNLALPATSFDDILGRLIATLEECKGDAPLAYQQTDTNSKYFNTGRITKGAIYAMLTDMYLWQKNYQKCIECANEVIKLKRTEAEKDKNYDEADFQYANGYPLIPARYTKESGNKYGRYYNEVFAQGASLETIFELSYLKNRNEIDEESNGAYSDFYGANGGRTFVTFSSFVGYDDCDKKYELFDEKNAGFDLRSYATFSYASKRPQNIIKNSLDYRYTIMLDQPNPEKENEQNDFFDKSSWGSRYGVYAKNKFNFHPYNKTNVIIYRLSDIMLLAAEAYTQLITQADGDLTSAADVEYRDKAFELVSAVNTRSIMQASPSKILKVTDYKTKDDISELVMKERHREFLFEGKRYYDLVRHALRDGNTKYIAEKCARKSPDLKSAIESRMARMDAIFWPYNNDEIKANPQLHQNSAFDSGEDKSNVKE